MSEGVLTKHRTITITATTTSVCFQT